MTQPAARLAYAPKPVAPIDKVSLVIAIVLGRRPLGDPLSFNLALGCTLLVAGTVLSATI
jgi:uncharacterized membrane protein